MTLVVHCSPFAVSLKTELSVVHRLVEGSGELSGAEQVVPWWQLLRLAAVDPWPSFEMTWQDQGGSVLTQRYHPLRLHTLFSFVPSEVNLLVFEGVVEELFDHATRYWNGFLERGWLDVADDRWEEVGDLPKDGSTRSFGAYRTAASPIVAHREPPGPMRALLTWLSSSPERPWRETTREVAMTGEHLYVENWDGSRWRVPLSTVRRRLTNEVGDCVWVFSRRNFLILPRRDDCPVTSRLEGILQKRASMPPAAE